MIDTPLIRIDRHESGVVEVVLDRPEAMNAVSTQMATALTAAGASLAEDTSVRGVPIAKGESVYLAYTSGNRDEDVFDDPFIFDIGRFPNKHLSFGYGVHFCLGAALARMEMRSFFAELIPRLDSIELAGTPELAATVFVGGLKHLPIRYSLR